MILTNTVDVIKDPYQALAPVRPTSDLYNVAVYNHGATPFDVARANSANPKICFTQSINATLSDRLGRISGSWSKLGLDHQRGPVVEGGKRGVESAEYLGLELSLHSDTK